MFTGEMLLSKKGERQKGAAVKVRCHRRPGSIPMGWVDSDKPKTAPRHGDGLKCCLCNNIAHNKVLGKGFCPGHYKEACVAQAKINANPNIFWLNYESGGAPRGAYLAQRSIE